MRINMNMSFMMKFHFFVIFFIFTISDITSQRLQTPCPEFFQYSYANNEYIGLLELPPPQLGDTVKLTVNLKVRAPLPSKYYGALETVGTRESIIRDIIARRNVRYKITFPIQNPLPKLSSIVYDSRIICTGAPEFGGIVTMIKLEHTLYTAAALQASERLQRILLEQSIPKNSRRRPKHNERLERFEDYEEEENEIDDETDDMQMQSTKEICGKPLLTSALIFGGKGTARGEFPWLAALYKKTRKGSMEFKCGATLVSSNAVITAAHCVKFNSDILAAHQIVILLGKHDMDDFSEVGSQTHYVKEVIPHPGFMSKDTSFDADIAVILLRKPVVFSQQIRPLCVWESHVGLRHVPGDKGTVIGWGKDSVEGPMKSVPNKLEMPIVSDAVCLRAHESFQHMTSKRTFCAGNSNYTGPCNGDSGGPFMFKRVGKWFLKGIVSASPIDIETHSCDLSTYVVFTDVLKFVPWLKQFISEI